MSAWARIPTGGPWTSRETGAREASGEHLDRQVAVGHDTGHVEGASDVVRHDDGADMVLTHQRGHAVQRLPAVEADDVACADRFDAHGISLSNAMG
jgi:hypothetical protein